MEAVAYARVSLSSIDRLIANGSIRLYRPTPNRRLIARADLDRYLRGTGDQGGPE